jgi:FkbM family methyltransferase
MTVYRRARVRIKQALSVEPIVPLEVQGLVEYHGDEYCGWAIPANSLRDTSVVVDVGLGENVSFSRSLIDKYGCVIHGFDPTPRAIEYVRRLNLPRLVLHECGLDTEKGEKLFHLPDDERYVSGSLVEADYNRRRTIKVPLVSLEDVFSLTGMVRMDLLKLDIEGTEYALFGDSRFTEQLERVGILCLEFHHRWANFGKGATEKAVRTLNELGFRCAWREPATNEEFTFVNTRCT